MSVVAAVRGEVPPHRYAQAEVTEALIAMLAYMAEARRNKTMPTQANQTMRPSPKRPPAVTASGRP